MPAICGDGNVPDRIAGLEGDTVSLQQKAAADGWHTCTCEDGKGNQQS
jgi:hypothetical protein